MNKYFTSDWHFNETRIGDFNPFFRPFKNIEEQNKVIIDNLNAIVKEDDTLYMLGDVSIDREGVNLLNLVRCKNRILVIGNYDEDKLALLSPHFSEVVRDMEIDLNGLPCYLNHYPVNFREDRFNITGHIHGLWKVKPNMVNVGVDAWHFKPVSEEEIAFVHNAINKHYDANVFVHCR